MLMTEAVKPTGRPIEDHITTEEAIRSTGYTDQYLRRMAKEGKILALKWGHMWMLHRASLKEYARRAESTQDKRFGPREDA
jgi:excisionase family DNA binding protein